MKSKENKSTEIEVPFDPDALKADILREAKVIGIPSGTAEMIAKKVVKQVTDWAMKKSILTQDDLGRKVCNELAKYHADLVYVYQNRDKII